MFNELHLCLLHVLLILLNCLVWLTCKWLTFDRFKGTIVARHHLYLVLSLVGHRLLSHIQQRLQKYFGLVGGLGSYRRDWFWGSLKHVKSGRRSHHLVKVALGSLWLILQECCCADRLWLIVADLNFKLFRLYSIHNGGANFILLLWLGLMINEAYVALDFMTGYFLIFCIGLTQTRCILGFIWFLLVYIESFPHLVHI